MAAHVARGRALEASQAPPEPPHTPFGNHPTESPVVRRSAYDQQQASLVARLQVDDAAAAAAAVASILLNRPLFIFICQINMTIDIKPFDSPCIIRYTRYAIEFK